MTLRLWASKFFKRSQKAFYGIPEEIQETLFEVFVTKGKEKGTGLGMSTVKNIVEAHGGEISFETKLGEGTKFMVSLPVVKS